MQLAYPGGELTGKTTEMYVCQDCRDALKIPEERIKVVRIRLPKVEFVTGEEIL